MAKMFYSLEEAAQRLGKSPAEVQQMASSGQLQEFKDRDKLMFKREQVDLLAGGKGDSASFIPLAGNEGSSMGLQLDDSGGSKAGSKGGSGHIELDDPASKEKSGISIFDTEGTEEGDPSAVTRITETRGGEDITLESVGSGSGLLDLTREADDTSLGADLLEDVYKPDEEGGSGGSQTQGASGLFETTAAPSDVAAAAAAAGMGGIGMVAAEPYDGLWSGITGGAALVATLVVAVTLVTVLMGLMGADNPIAAMVGANVWMYVGIGALLLLICAGIGAFLGKRTG